MKDIREYQKVCFPGIREAVAIIGMVFILYLLFWHFLGSGEIFGSDRGHVFLVGDKAPGLLSCFEIGGQDRYRPLAVFIEGRLTAVATTKGLFGWYVLVILNGLFLGINTYLFYSIARILANSNVTASLAVILMLFSNATISVPWTVLFSVFYAAPLFLIYIMLYGYLRYKDSQRPIWILPIVIGGILAPWFREIGVLGAVVIFGVEAIGFIKKRSAFIIIPFLLMMHGLFSTAIPAFLHLYAGGVRLVFHGPEIKANFPVNIVNWWRSGRILNELSPALWILIITSIAYFLYRVAIRMPTMSNFYEMLLHGSFGWKGRETRNGQYVRAATLAALFVLFSLISFSLLFVDTHSPEASGLRPLKIEILLILFVCILAVISAFRVGSLPAIWILPQFLFLIKQPNNFEAHLVFITPALCIISSVWLVDILKKLTTVNKTVSLNLLRLFVYAFFTWGMMDQILNLYSAFNVNRNIIRETQKAADWIGENVAHKSIIFVNSFPSFEILHRTGWIYDVRWISPVGPITHHPDYRAITDYKEQLKYIKQASEKGRNVYYLILTSKNFEGPYYLPNTPLEIMNQWTIRLPQNFLDPLRYFIQKPTYMQVYAPFQWRASVEEFNADNDAFGWDLEFSLSKLRSKDIPLLMAESLTSPDMIGESISPRLVFDGFKDTNYNIIEFRGVFYALWRGEGPFVLEKVEAKGYSTPVFIANSQKEIEALLDDAQSTGKIVGKSSLSNFAAEDDPKLIVDGYRNTNYNIIYYRGKYYGLFRGEGAFLIKKIDEQGYSTPIFTADSLVKIKWAMDKQLIKK